MQDSECVRIVGAANIATIGEIHARLLAAYRDSDTISIDTAEISEVDLTFIQLVEAVRRSATASGKQIVLTGPADGPLLDTLMRGGFFSNQDCAAFWTCATESE